MDVEGIKQKPTSFAAFVDFARTRIRFIRFILSGG